MEDKATFYAYLTIHDFFDCFALETIISSTDTIIRWAAGHSIWKKEQPGDALFYLEKLEGLCSATFVIHERFSIRKEVMIDAVEGDVPDLFDTTSYCSTAFKSNHWNQIPRHLNPRQFFNPYKAINKFCHYMAEPEWTKTLQTLTMYALNTDSVLDLFPPYNIIVMRLRLLQMIEACHLIHVRMKNKEKMEEAQKTLKQKASANKNKNKK